MNRGRKDGVMVPSTGCWCWCGHGGFGDAVRFSGDTGFVVCVLIQEVELDAGGSKEIQWEYGGGINVVATMECTLMVFYHFFTGSGSEGLMSGIFRRIGIFYYLCCCCFVLSALWVVKYETES
jgi:hypothetical protein